MTRLLGAMMIMVMQIHLLPTVMAKRPCPGRALTPTAFALPPVDAITISTQLTSAMATYFGFLAYFDRPRGKLFLDQSDIEARQSQVEGAGLGL